MSSRTVELTDNQSVTLGVITRYKCISSAEIAYWTTLTENEIEGAIPTLIRERLIYLSPGGYPKRYCPFPEQIIPPDESEEDDLDLSYEIESSA